MNKTHHPKLKTAPCPLFSCGIFRNCTQSVLSPTAPPTTVSTFLQSPPPPQPPATDHPPPPPPSSSSSSSSSSSTSPSFTQWRFPFHHPNPSSDPQPPPSSAAAIPDLATAFHAADVYFQSNSPIPALRLLEKSLASDPSASGSACPPELIGAVVASLRNPTTARPAAKVLLAVLLAEVNRRAAVEAGAVGAAVEAVEAADGTATATAERALAALELMCTVEEGAEEVRGREGAVAAMATAVERMGGRGRECGMGVMAAVYGGERAADAPPEVGRAVVAALQGECTARGRRKGAALLRALEESGRLDLAGNWE